MVSRTARDKQGTARRAGPGARPPAPRFGLFVEGAHYDSKQGRDWLVELWRELASWHGVAPERVDVHGFHKGQVEMMAKTSGFVFPATQPLDVQIARAYDHSKFDVLVVAIDALPTNVQWRARPAA